MAEQLFQVGVKGLIRNDKTDILMVHVPAWRDNPAYWDLPGGRMNPGETFLETLGRELQEEIGVTYTGDPKQLAVMLTGITIPVGDVRVPLVLVIYEAAIPAGSQITLDPNSSEEAYEWFAPADAANKMAVKFSPEFCDLVRGL